MKKLLICMGAATLMWGASAAEPQFAPAEPADMRPIFNGKDLSGWDGDTTKWSVKDGVLRGETTPENPAKGNTFLVWQGGQTKNFELRLSFRCTANNNSGIQYRSIVRPVKEGDANRWRMKGYQHEIRNELHLPNVAGFLYDEGGKRKRICLVGEKALWQDGKKQIVDALISGDEFKKLFKLNEWNDVVIIAQGTHLRHYLNNRLVMEFTDSTDEALLEGKLGLQLHAGKPMWTEFKNIRFKALD